MNSDSVIPLISVIIPSFNSGNTIIQSVSSVIRELESVIGKLLLLMMVHPIIHMRLWKILSVKINIHA